MADHAKFHVEVLTPEGNVFDDEVEMVSTRTETGSIGILAGHTPLLALLSPAELRLYESENDYTSFAQGEGYIQVAAGRVLVLVEEATPPDDLDKSDLEDKLKEAEDRFSKCDDNTEEQRQAARDRRRWERFIKITEGDGGNA